LWIKPSVRADVQLLEYVLFPFKMHLGFNILVLSVCFNELLDSDGNITYLEYAPRPGKQ
jgi:hypothetical protein